MNIDINEIKNKINQVNEEKQLFDLKVEYLGKTGIISKLMKGIKDSDNKKEFGGQVNEIKTEISTLIENKRVQLNELQIESSMKNQAIDVTIPGRKNHLGIQNILLQTAREIEGIFTKMGYDIAQGQEIETDYYNFDALNLHKDHPARDMQDTFYINPELLLRTHTSNVQSRVLSQNINTELKIICPGKVYRRDDDDATHLHQFTQVEGLVVMKKANNCASLKDLKTTLTIFAQQIFKDKNIKLRMRNSYFPFTEPSVEVDISCSKCQGDGCNICKRTGWIEILGAGIIHQNVLSNAGFDAKEYTGFAFGIGVERIAMLKYQIEDIRHFYINDFNFTKQFNK